MEYAAGNIFVRQMYFDDKPNRVVEGHKHNFDHVTYIAKGSVLVEELDDEGNVVKSIIKDATQGFNWILIKAGVRHRLTGMEEGCIAHCIYSHRNPQDEIVLDYDGWYKGYV